LQDYLLALESSPTAEEVQIIRSGLSAYNVRQMPELLNLPDDDIAIFVRDENGVVQGGVVGEADWGMLYVDLLWLSDSLRGQGYGKALLHTIEQTARKKGMPSIYLMTTEFQALSFYQHMGYTLFGTMMNRPHGYAYYYLCKLNIERSDITYDLPITFSPSQIDVRMVNRGLRDYCEQYVDCTSQLLNGFIRRTNGEIVGGIIGSTYWDWYDLRYFWIADELRGKGYGKQLLQLAEAECRQRGVTGIVCDTADFQALPFYQSQGFEVFGTLSNRPPKHTSYFLQKLL